MIILPSLAFLLFFLILKTKRIDKRRAFLAAATFCGTSVVLITESLSVLRLVNRRGVAVFWLLIDLICLIIYSRRSQFKVAPWPERHIDTGEVLQRTEKRLLIAAVVIVALVGTTALIAAPSGEDVICYHLPRVSMWISNYNIKFFPTPNYTQLIYGAFAEYSIMHTMLLWGNDRLANIVEFCSFVGSAVAVSYIVKAIGGCVRAQMLGAILSITIPQGILEASNSMNTYSAAFWIVTMTAFLSAWKRKADWLNTICIGLAAGLALFTKGTTYIILPFIVVAPWWIGTRSSLILFLKRSIVTFALILAINGPQYLRNYEFDGSPLGVPLNYGELDLTVKHISFKSTVANVVRNISLHAGTPENFWSLEPAFRAIISTIGVDPDDPDQVSWGSTFRVNQLSFNEMVAGNPLQLILLLTTLPLVFASGKQNRALVWYSIGLMTSFVTFCAILKWQPWSSRHHLAFFVLASVIIAMVLARCCPHRVVTTIAIVLLCSGSLNASLNRFRSLVPVGRWQSVYEPRSSMYFAYHNDFLAPSYIASAEAVNRTGCANVGVDSYTPLSDPQIITSPHSFFVYPILAMMHVDGHVRRAWFSGVHNLSARYAAQQPHPPECAIVCLDCADVPAKWDQYHSFLNYKVFGNNVVFMNGHPPIF